MQESTVDPRGALRPTVIEVGGEPLGVVVPHAQGFRFLAVKLPAFAVDGELFETVEQAHFAVTRAARNHQDP